MHVGQYDQYYLAVVAVVGTLLAVIFLLWLTQRSRYAGFIRTYRGIAATFLNVIGVLFALNLAFLANDTWLAHDRARQAVSQEAGALRSILALAERLPAASRAKVDGAVTTYARQAATADWPLLALRQSSPAVAEDLNALLMLLASEEVAAQVNAPVQSLLLQQAVQVRSMRDLRIALSDTHVNPFKWLGMAFLGFLTMISIAMVHVDSSRAEFLAIALFAAAAAPTAGIILVHGNPFQQPASVSAAPIAAIAQEATTFARPLAP
ncbi:MAG: hypothetical protein U1E42_03400 [Rhodospirillales bacterium]